MDQLRIEGLEVQRYAPDPQPRVKTPMRMLETLDVNSPPVDKKELRGGGPPFRKKGIGVSGSATPEEHAVFFASVASPSPSKPRDVEILEGILTEAYDAEVEITHIEDLPLSRKPVRQVYFVMNDLQSQVWVFKADPVQTLFRVCLFHNI
ncbi:hypothetical protein CMO92_03615 [Candidatus Woesearchaeota archaeon]|nr:hypothetical protein [Candidatus Woesearchaeota archaeon]|tara:strand:- start:193 stop:642 length:450 start_codon:yes stop_codon:yes gene_type:complete